MFVSGLIILLFGLAFFFASITILENVRNSQNLGGLTFGIIFLTDAIALLVVGSVLVSVGVAMAAHVPQESPARFINPGDIVSIGGVRARVEKVRGSSIKVNGIWVSTRQVEFEKRDREN